MACLELISWNSISLRDNQDAQHISRSKEWTKSIEWHNILSEVLRWVRFHNVSDFLGDSSLQLRYLLRHGVLGWCDPYWIRVWAEKNNKVVISIELMRSWIGMIWHMANPICSRFPLPRTGCWYHEESVIYEWGSYWWPQSLSKVWLKIIYVNHRQRYNCFKQWHNHSNQSLSWGDEILEDELDRRAATPHHGGAILPPSCASCAFTHLEMCCNLTDLQQSSFVHVKSWHCCRFGLQLLFRGVEQMPKSRPKRLNPARLALLKAGPFVTPVCEIQQVQMSAASRIPIFSNSNSTTIGKAETKKRI